MRSSKKPGVSLAEVVLSLFLLTACAVLIFGMFHSGLQFTTRSKKLGTAVRVSENALAAARVWGRDPANFDSDWSGLTNPYVDPTAPGFSVTYVVAPRSSGNPANLIYSPCSAFEVPLAAQPGGARSLEQSVITVQVRCPYGYGDEVVLTTAIGEPDRIVRATDPVTTTRSGASDPVAQNDTTTIQGSLVQQGGDVIEDVMFEWLLTPTAAAPRNPGNGTLVDRIRDGSEVGIKHIYMKNHREPDLPPDNPLRWQWVGGVVGITPYARYKGKIYPDPDLPPLRLVDLEDVP